MARKPLRRVLASDLHRLPDEEDDYGPLMRVGKPPPKPVPKSGRTTLYRLFNAEGDLLYVGITSEGLTRLNQHQREKHWFYEVAEAKLEHFTSRDVALRAEARAISREHPRYNLMGAG